MGSRTCAKSNQDWKLRRSSKMFGNKKFSSAQSSVRSFCSGVPLNSSRFAELIVFSSRISRQSLFLSRCPSSIVRYFHSVGFARSLPSALQRGVKACTVRWCWNL